MHLYGKILIGLIVISALGAIALVGKLYDVQNSWAREVDRIRQTNEQNAEAIAEKTRTLDRLRAEYDQEMEYWGRYWNEIPTGVGADGRIRAQGLGRNQRFGFPQPEDRPQPPTAFAFRIEPDGSSTYIGTFQAQQVREDESELAPNFLVQEGEVQEWEGNLPWRFRRQVPAPLKNRASDLRSTLHLAYDRLTEQERYLADQAQLEESAREHLEGRRRELLGAEGRPGLVTQIETEEEARNEALEDLDRLRRQVKATYDAIRQGIDRNGRLARSLEPSAERASAR